MAKTGPFDENFADYEQWFVDNHFVFKSEVEAIKTVLPARGKGLEIGVGSGIFASELGIEDGVEPSYAMRVKALERHINAIDGVAEKLPCHDKSYDYALMVTTICFVDDIVRSFNEVYRVLTKNGTFVIGFVDKASPLGKIYMRNKDRNVFYKDAVFYSTGEVSYFLHKTGFAIETMVQTVFGLLDTIMEIQMPQNGYGKGNFIVIKAIKL